MLTSAFAAIESSIHVPEIEAAALLEDYLGYLEDPVLSQAETSLASQRNTASYWLLVNDADYNRAPRLILAAREVDADNPYWKDTHAFALIKRGDFDGALPLVESAAEDLPDDPDVLVHLLQTYQGLNRRKAATRVLETLSAFDLSPYLDGLVEDARRKLDTDDT